MYTDNVLGTACAWNGTTFFRHGTARLHLSFCRDGLKIGTGPSTGAILTAHTDFFHGTARQSVNTCVKAGTARLIFRHGKSWQCKRCRLSTCAKIFNRAEHYQIRRSRHPYYPCRVSFYASVNALPCSAVTKKSGTVPGASRAQNVISVHYQWDNKIFKIDRSSSAVKLRLGPFQSPKFFGLIFD